MEGLEYTFSDTIKIWQGSKSTWHYVSLPVSICEEIHTLNQYHQTKRRGWGAVKVDAMLNGQHWHTSIFPAFGDGRYALFLKAEVRKGAKVVVGDQVTVAIKILF
ncbi:DUF1905 domain-containing protein [Methylophilus flavus]|uniref:DUF1905 domain-containing protein n=1 Tax=Methylophilus flavus TaxID=640084 RepID=A0ABW3PC98_9PROT